ncbi:ATP-dependent DNA ligase [Microcoleus sp. FACHB-831]|uniref:ATP-dependent DNA ligase n=1 Tax=Microcoleus sp. FACHB-831 TaxID=2692827 RepID=UPI0016880314|nr:ATP-dependent DNA ligase [Microcoleus sp. FACHB-831]MBD1919761.1 ATP-dependent DNA ligase [Microcoleus sp. FACHB-831]
MTKNPQFTRQNVESETSFNQNPELNPGAFIDFASVAENVGATTKRLTKASLLGSYFTSLSDNDLVLAARYFSGYIFPLRDQRTINIGGAALLTAIAAVSEQEKSALQERLVKLGDPGDVTEEAFTNNPQRSQHQPILTLSSLSNQLELLAATTGTKRKTELVIELLKMATPLEAKYMVKLLAGDLRIGLKEGAVEDAIARLFQTNVSKVQWVNMLIGDIGETALLARTRKLDEAQMRLFHPIKFMLATPADDLTEVAKQMPDGFAVEDKYDGIRAQIHIASYLNEDNSILHGTVCNGKRVAIFSRTLDEITATFPDLIEPLAAINLASKDSDEAVDLILDGEIVPIQGERILPFQELQKRLGRKKVSYELLAAVPVAFIAYDVLYAFGRILINEPFAKRRSLLESIHLDTQRVRCGLSQQVSDISGLDAEFTAARARGNEGLMVKDLNSTYKPGRRGRDWLKIKRAMATLDVVVTAAEVGNGKRHRFLSDYTFAVRQSETEPTLLNIGKAYSGLTDAEVAELSEWFRAHTLQELAHGKVCIVEPRIVLEVTFDRVQPSSRHNSGYALRFPRIVRVRNDKPPEEIDTLETVRRLAETLSSESVTKVAEAFVDSAAPLENVSTSLNKRGNEVSDVVQLENDIHQTLTLEAACEAFRAFVDGIERDKSVVVLHDSDADGVTAGVVLQLALSRAGFENVKIVAPDRQRNAWTPANRERAIASAPDSLFVLDLGSQSEPVIAGVPTCFIDHHRPEGVPSGDTLISAYTWEPIPNTSLLVWELCSSLTDVSDLDWIAAIGTVSDLGEKAPFEMLAVAKSRYTAKYLKEASALINAARRASQYNPEVAVRALLTHDSPRSLVNSNTEDVEQLRLARKEVQAAMEQAKKAAPVFSGNVALVRVNSPCQIHPLIAQSWRTRLPKYIVIVANEGYISGRVNFSVRTASGINVLDFLKSVDLSPGEGSYGHGHDSASGGSLPVERWNELLSSLGFET